MKTKILLAAMITSMMVYMLSSCYQNNDDLAQLPVEKVSFKKEVVPIMISGACGCHNLGDEPYAQFSHKDTIFYDVILARVAKFDDWVNKGKGHPGMGTVYLSTSQTYTIKKWLAQGPPYDADDAGGCTTGGETYTATILPIYNTTCKGGSCHGGPTPALDYNAMVAKKSTIQNMMNNNGANGSHPGGTLSLTSCTVSKFKSWLTLNMPL